jgi:hypothetical protein
MFEALIALAQTNLTVQTNQRARDKDALFHYSRSLQRLREALSQPECIQEDSTLFGIIALMGVDFMAGDTKAFEMHLYGMRQIVALRGGIDQLGWPTILKPYLVAMEGFWAYMSRDQCVDIDLHEPSRSIADFQHPYNRVPIAGLDELISTLPPGFRDLALNYRLSLPVITLISRSTLGALSIDQIGGGRIDIPNATSMQETEYAARLLACSRLTVIERSICVGIMISIMERTMSERFSSLYTTHIQQHAEELLIWQGHFKAPDLAELYLWAAMKTIGTLVPTTHSAPAALHEDDSRFELLMSVVQRYSELPWPQVLDLIRKFIVVPKCIKHWQYAWELGLKYSAQGQPRQAPSL